MGQAKLRKVKAVLDPPENDKELEAFGQGILIKVTGNVNFGTPTPTVADLGSALTAYGAAIVAFDTQKGTGEAKASARQLVLTKLELLRGYVEYTARLAPASQQQAIIESAGMRVKKVTTLAKPPLAAKYGSNSGAVILIALAAAANADYFWSYSTDQKNWTEAPNGMKATTTLSGLTAGTTYWFRVRAQTRKGLSDWCAPVSLVVR